MTSMTDAMLHAARLSVLSDVSSYADFLGGASEEREPSDYWGHISTADLVRLSIGGRTQDGESAGYLQRDQAHLELIERYVASMTETIRAEVARMEQEKEAEVLK